MQADLYLLEKQFPDALQTLGVHPRFRRRFCTANHSHYAQPHRVERAAISSWAAQVSGFLLGDAQLGLA